MLGILNKDMITVKKIIPGSVAAFALAVVAYNIGERIPWMGGAACGIAMGVAIASIMTIPAVLKPGLTKTGKYILQLAIILLGAGMNLDAAWRTGVETLAIMLVTISAVYVVAWFVGRLLGVRGNARDLVATGTAICGGSAIAAVAPVVQAKDEEISYAISVIFLFNLAAVFIFPFLGDYFHLSPAIFGAWAGTAVNDTSSVMAAAYAFSNESVETAALVKMTRTTMIVPIALIFSIIVSRRAAKMEQGGGDGDKTAGKFSFTKTFPWFVLGFLAMSLWSTWGGMPVAWSSASKFAGKFLIVVALSAIGLNTDIRKLLSAGIKPIILGAVLWAVVATLGLLMLL